MMKGITIWAAGALALTAAAAAAQKPDTPPPPGPAPGSSITVDADFLIGVWSDNPNCSSPIEFRRDGVFINADRSQGAWRIVGDTVILTGARTVTARIVPRNRQEITVVNADGSSGYSRRCDIMG